MAFTLDNIPYGIGSSAAHPSPQHVTRYNDNIIFLAVLQEHGFFEQVSNLPAGIFSQPVLNNFVGLPKAVHREVRVSIQQALQNENLKPLPAAANVMVSECTLHLPLRVKNFTGFSCSKEHNLHAGEVILGTTNLPPAFYRYPLGYTVRASSVRLTGTPVQRPLGLSRDPSNPGKVVFGPERNLDFELEIGCVIGQAVEGGIGCSVEKASEHIFGLLLLNDWSARSIQELEMRPLGPLNGKSFHTTISPWIITWEALEACQIDALSLEAPPAPYLQREKRKIPSITLQVEITKADEPNSKTVVCTTRSEYLYWTFEDMIVQQTINGCSLRPGDILATGTVSGSQESERGCLIESTFGGKEPLTLSDNTTRGYLEDGDVVRLTGTGIITGSNNVLDFGESTAQVVPARR